MMLAPQPQLRGTLQRYSEGFRGVQQTIRIMRRHVNEAKIDPVIRQAATTVVFLTREKEDGDEAAALLEFVQRSIRYVKDIHDVETISSAEKTLAGRVGDCDDQSVLLASMLEAVGYPTRFVVTGYSDPRVCEHVFLETLVDGEWLAADPTERGPLGWAPPDAVCCFIERV